jgi:V/A-type H+-transporting ATPase subunit I
MKEVTVIVHHQYLPSLIRRLHEAGFVEISETMKTRENYSKLVTQAKAHDEAIKCISYGLRINRIIDILNRAAPPQEGLFKSFTRPEPRPRVLVQHKETTKHFAETEQILGQIENDVLDIESQISELDEKLGILENQKTQIKMLRPIRFNLGYLGSTKHLIIKAGTVDSIDQLKTALSGLENVDYKFAEVEEKYSVVIAAHSSQRMELESKLRGRLFTEFDISGFQGTPEAVLNKLDNEIKMLNTKKENLLSKLKIFYTNWHKRLFVLDEELENERERHDVFGKFGETKSTKIISGWVLTKDQERLKRICAEQTNGHAICHFRDPDEDNENIPIKLQNPGWCKPFEVLTTLFATPRYNEIDPTLVIAIPFVFFFGLMLGDAGYGAVIFALCLFGYFHLGKIRPVVKQASYIGIFMGFFTIFFGLIMGSVFGDLIPRLIYGDPSIPLYQATVLGFNLPYDPVRDPIILLQVALIIGLFYITLSVGTAAGDNIKHKNYKDLLLGQLSWLIFLIPFGLILIFYAFFKYEFSTMVLNLSYIMIIIGLILLFIDKKALFFFDLTGYLGDTLSFARLLALGLATAGIAMTINIIAELVLSAHTFLIVVVVVILFFSHLINFVLQALGAGIHSLRLQYVEFFARCYEGGGKNFQPFMAKHIITKSESRKKS